jgi:hypothetical protein
MRFACPLTIYLFKKYKTSTFLFIRRLGLTFLKHKIMKNKKIVSLVAAGALIANLALVAAVSADTNTTMDQAISAGTLAIDALPTVSSWSDLNVSLTAQESNVSAAANSLQFSDMRAQPATTYALATKATHMLDIPSGVTFAVTNFLIRTHAGAAQVSDEANSTECAQGDARAAYIPQAITNQWTARDTDGKSRAMDCKASPDFRLSVPAQQSSGSYRTTVTWSIA